MADNPFVFTDRMVVVSNQLWAVTAMVGAALCGAVVLVIGLIALNPVARPHLDRVSFRILVCALLANTVFGITNAIGGKFTGPTWACGFTIFLLQLTLEMSSFLLFSIALNLQLVVVHRVNGQKMEKFYIFGSILISLCLTVPPYAAKQYGWDPLVKDCWYSNADQKQRLAWQIGTQLFWTMLTVVGEIGTASTVVIYMMQHHLRARRSIHTGSFSTGSRTRSRSGSVSSIGNRVAHANAYRAIILRICLYPMASAVINITSVACVIHATQQGGVHNWTGYHVLLLSDFVYGGRAVVYALLAATDPAFVRAVGAFINDSRGKSRIMMSSAGGRSTTQVMSIPGQESKDQNLSVHIELSTIRQNDSGMITSHQVPDKDGQELRHAGYVDSFHALKPGSDTKDGLHDHALDEVESNWVDNAVVHERRIRMEREVDRRREETLAREKDRDDFKKQI